jgi:acetylornithine/N-succinyldiaminopimelate aminotransferase
LNVILEEGLVNEVNTKGSLFKSLLVHPLIKEVRGKGLMMCIQLDSFEQVEKVSRLCAAEGLVIDWFLHCETALRLAPPLIITEEEIRIASSIILKALDLIK